MEISQEDLDKQLEEARTKGLDDGKSAKASELKGDVERAKSENDQRVRKMEEESQRKVSEHSAELGTLRKDNEELKTARTERDEFKKQLDKRDTDAATEEERRKKAEEKAAAEPGLVLSSMKDDEATAIDAYVKSDKCTDEVRQALNDADKKDVTLAAILQGIRDSKPSDRNNSDAGPAAMWLQGNKNTNVTDPNTIREIVRDGLKQKDRQTNALPGVEVTVINGGKGPNDTGKVKHFNGFKQSMGVGTT